ncbi:MAG: hypothetical protein ACLFPJ_04070 [Candidatus Woesearchaeota archaeon]
MERTLEDKLRNVKKNIVSILENNELNEKEYFCEMYNLTKNEEIFIDNEENNNTCSDLEKSTFIGSMFRVIRPIKIEYGLKDNYICLENNEIKSKEIKEDIKNFKNVENIALQYLKNKNTKKYTKEEFVNNYLTHMKSEPILKDIKDERKYLICLSIYNCIIPHDAKFKTEDKVSQYKEKLYNIIKRL